MIKSKTADLLTKIRKDNNYTQTDLSEKLGVSYQAVSKWERGENLPDSLLLLEIAKLYKITVDEILRGELIKIQKSNMSRKNKMITILAIVLLMLSPISVFVVGVNNTSTFVVILLCVGAISIALLLFVSFNGKEYIPNPIISLEEKRHQDMVYSACIGIFLILGLVFNLWYVAWVVFIFGYVITLYLKK